MDSFRDVIDATESGLVYDLEVALEAMRRVTRCPLDQTAIGSFSGPREGCDHFPPVKFDGWQCARCGITAEELAGAGGIK